ncbi:hypothetical protein [Methanosarcina siciliae]|nr:hypothetical protein [Methanosarcina siciliae]
MRYGKDFTRIMVLTEEGLRR